LKKRAVLGFALVGLLVVAGGAFAETTLRFSLWRDLNTWDGTMEVIDEFMRRYPDIKIEVEVPSGSYTERLLTMHVAGVAPDVMLSEDEPYQSLIEAGVFMDITHLIERDAALLKEQMDDYWPSQHEVTIYKGRYFGLPGQVGGGVVTYINRDLFDQSGLAAPADDWTFDDLVEAGRRMTEDRNGDGSPDQWGIALTTSWPYALNWIWSGGGSLLNEDRTRSVLDQVEAIDGLQFMHDLIHVYGVAPAPGTPGVDWVGGAVGVRFLGSWDFGQSLANLPFNWDVAHLPKHPERGTRGTRVSWNIATISPQTQHLEAAWEFLKFFSSIEASRIIWEQSRMPFPPSVSVARTMVDPNTPQREEVMIEALLEYGRLQPITPYWNEMGRVFAPRLAEMLQGVISPAAAATLVADEINTILAASE